MTKVTLAEGTHAHVLVSPVEVKPESITISGYAPISNFTLKLPKPSIIEHEIPVKGNSQVRVPHAPVKLEPGTYERSIAQEYNPFTQESMENYD